MNPCSVSLHRNHLPSVHKQEGISSGCGFPPHRCLSSSPFPISKDKITTARPIEKIFFFLPGNNIKVLLHVVEINQKEEQKHHISVEHILQVKTWEKRHEDTEM